MTKISFNLWYEPWITLEKPDGQMEVLGIEQTLRRAHEFRTIYEPSPLVIVGVQRLLIAITQAIYDPQTPSDLKRVWLSKQFDADKIAQFGAAFAHRFDLFSEDVPFMQSADLPMKPDKTPQFFAASLFNELSSGSNVTHFNHGNQKDKKCCPKCCAGGLISLSAFALPAGRGYSTSVVGVPPLFALPCGKSLFHALTASTILPAYKPKTLSANFDNPCWDRSPIVEKAKLLTEIGYLQGLTFIPRRVRLHPVCHECTCTRCGQVSNILVNSIAFESGEVIDDSFGFWQDPFVAYVVKKDKPVPIYISAGKVLWRNYHTLFLRNPISDTNHLLRPSVLDQICDLELFDDMSDVEVFRCIGIRSDQASVDEWVESSLEVSNLLLILPDGGLRVEKAIGLAEECIKKLVKLFHDSFNQKPSGKSDLKRKRYLRSQNQMQKTFWASLAMPFHTFVLALGGAQDRDAELYRWVDVVRAKALEAFTNAAEQVGDDAVSLRQRVQGELNCAKELKKLRKKYIPETEQEKIERELNKMTTKKTIRSKKS